MAAFTTALVAGGRAGLHARELVDQLDGGLRGVAALRDQQMDLTHRELRERARDRHRGDQPVGVVREIEARRLEDRRLGTGHRRDGDVGAAVQVVRILAARRHGVLVRHAGHGRRHGVDVGAGRDDVDVEILRVDGGVERAHACAVGEQALVERIVDQADVAAGKRGQREHRVFVTFGDVGEVAAGDGRGRAGIGVGHGRVARVDVREVGDLLVCDVGLQGCAVHEEVHVAAAGQRVHEMDFGVLQAEFLAYVVAAAAACAQQGRRAREHGQGANRLHLIHLIGFRFQL
ncbi:hypothetical protein PT2222_230065 [Paraburkholderia tropica]